MNQSTERRAAKRAIEDDEEIEIAAKRVNEGVVSQSDKENKPIDSNPTIDQDGSDTNDYLSQLPDIDLLEIFKHLPRTDINYLSSVNKRVHRITDDRSLSHIKSKCGKLFIYQTESSYCFKLRCYEEIFQNSKNNESLKTPSFKYEIWMDEDGNYAESRGLDDIEMYEKESSIYDVHDWAVPEQLFTALSQLLRNRALESVNVEAISFDANFLESLANALQYHGIEQLDCWEMQCDQITDQARASFIKLAETMKCVSLHCPNQSTLINEEFIRDISESKTLNEFKWFASHEVNLAHHFTPSQSIIPHLIRFMKFELPNMLIPAGWAAELLMKHMDSIVANSTEVGSWRFQLDCPIDCAEIREQIRKEDYEVDHELGNDLIIRKKDGYTARIGVQDYTVSETIIHISFVDFFLNSKYAL